MPPVSTKKVQKKIPKKVNKSYKPPKFSISTKQALLATAALASIPLAYKAKNIITNKENQEKFYQFIKKLFPNKSQADVASIISSQQPIEKKPNIPFINNSPITLIPTFNSPAPTKSNEEIEYLNAIKELQQEIRKIRFININGDTKDATCDAYNRLAKYIENSCKYAQFPEVCSFKRKQEYNLNTDKINKAVSILKCI